MRTFMPLAGLLLAASAIAAACNPTTSNPVGAVDAPTAPGIADAGAAPAAGAAAPQADATTPAAQVTETAMIAPMTEDHKTIYALGATYGRQILVFNLSPEELAHFEAGLRSAVMGTPPAVDPASYGSQFQVLANARRAAASAAILDRAAQEEGAVKTASGFVFKSLIAGAGESPGRNDTVSVNYRAMTIDGHEVDSSPASQLATFPLAGVIACWTEGLQMMKPGGKAKLVCPPALAYGDRGAPPRVPGGATLMFEIELVSVQK